MASEKKVRKIKRLVERKQKHGDVIPLQTKRLKKKKDSVSPKAEKKKKKKVKCADSGEYPLGKWVSIKKSLPPDTDEHIVVLHKDFFGTPDVTKAFVFNQHYAKSKSDKTDFMYTHWMPIQQKKRKKDDQESSDQ